ncbi:PREDICTED: uncharacterized protein LOC108361720 [Rhagoletis zephyria]|uniref:uncharacterized protein LOC108361720 n=1 Tax=Rhagoletis zephyria TaxID=28612 RepID=UPI0008113A6B|nr:PREDICTED: uncharacterized protein LOC108361720 [Rhagoletis zephyria]
MHDLIKDYFTVESFGVRAVPPIESVADIRAKKLLDSTTVKVNGRFQTGLLWKTDNIELPESYSMALKRLVGIERKIARNKEFGKAYREIINNYVSKGYARKLQSSEVAEVGSRTWYLPHFAVINPHKPGKLRLVFDAAATSHGVSLNSQLLKGPQQYRPLVSVLFHFREGAVAVCADIQEMFHQVVIRPEDRCAQRFLWRNGDIQQTPDVYEMTAMMFGAACSPCSAHYVKVKNAMEHSNHDPRAIQAITDYHYVDDYVDSFRSASRAMEISKQVRDIHKDAGFQLRKFRSNSLEVATALGGENTALSIMSKEAMESGKVLGMLWQPSSDHFTYRLEFHGVDSSVISGDLVPTKRMLLSIVMSIFDPLGFLCHLTITAKLVMREIWKRDLGWDEHVPNEINDMWNNFRMQLLNVVECKVPRHYFKLGQPKNLQLHIFVDASEDAFGAVAFWRAEYPDNAVQVCIVYARTRSAPLKMLTIPRLELQAAVLGSRMMTTIIEEHTMSIDRCVLWSDSRTVLKWIASEHRRYKPFVAHRIAEILSVSTQSDWRWVPTKENVADEATRVKRGVNLNPSSRWFTGPAFLCQPEHIWPTDDTPAANIDENEELRPKYALLIAQSSIFDFERFSSFLKLKRVVAWVLRYIHYSKSRPSQPDTSSKYGLMTSELDAAERIICRHSQREIFVNEVIRLEKGLSLPSESPLYKLSPWIDNEGLLRVHGRLDAVSWLAYDTKHPIILPSHHVVSRLIVAQEHKRMMHQNTEATICMIRQRYWIPNLRKVVRGVIANCNTCKLKKAKPVTPMMGLLPEDRVTPYVRPFTYTGLDYFGPVNVTVGRRTEKRWVALFTCLTVRAIHLEVAYDLSTDSCILAIRNFMNRRGVPRRIRSDNGKNFIGIAGEVRRFSDVFDCRALQGELTSKGVEWVFNCPENPSEGGAWERMVQCVKKVLCHTMKEVSPKEHTFNSLLVEAENVVNSRPLTHLPVTAEQEEPLTPNHFLLGSANTAQTPSCDESDQKLCSLQTIAPDIESCNSPG